MVFHDNSFCKIVTVSVIAGLVASACSNQSHTTPEDRSTIPLTGVEFHSYMYTDTTDVASDTNTIVASTMNKYAASTTDSSPFVPGGYLFVTFKGESTPMTEQIYFGLSPDGLKWEALNSAAPVLVSSVGEKGVRDPYILRSHDGKKFYIIATDLSINLNSNWTRAIKSGSKSIVVWESTDLVRWSTPRLVKVATDNAGCTWAPEAMYDEKTNDYLVYWSSTTSQDNYVKQRIYSARTTDFTVFSKPEIYLERPDNIIDADIIHNAGNVGDNKYYRFSKDDYTDKSIIMEVASEIAGPWAISQSFTLNTSQDAIRHLEGPAAFFRFTPSVNQSQNGVWCLMLDYPGQGYRAYTTADLTTAKFTLSSTMVFPFEFRHGSVLPLSDIEYKRVKSGQTTGILISREYWQ